MFYGFFMVQTHVLVDYCESLLALDCADGCPNGLQVQGASSIKHLVTGVSASLEFLEKAVDVGADALLVHHGYFWSKQPRVITGWMYERLSLIMKHDLSLLAYHLPLDYHRELGNNVQLAKQMGWHIERTMPSLSGVDIGMIGELEAPLSQEDFAISLENKLDHKPLVIAGHGRVIKRIAWVTGAAGCDMVYADEANVDAFITGEISENMVHEAKERGLVLVAAGHHATERYGVQAVGAVLAKKFDIMHTYVDIACPI